MSRSGYTDDCDGWALIRWRGAVNSAIRGKRGQAMLREMLEALDAMPVKRLIADDLVRGGEYCAIGVLGAKRGIKMDDIDPYDQEKIALRFDIAQALAQEIAFVNDEVWMTRHATPEARWQEVRDWVATQIKAEPK